MITLMFYQTMLANKCLNITSYCVCVQQPHPECWLAQQKYRTISHYVEIQRNSNLEFSITWLTQLWSMCGCCNGKCVPRKSKCNESEGIQNRFHKNLCKLGTRFAHRQTAVFWHNWRSNKDSESLLLPWGMFKRIQVVTGLYGRTSEQHANSQHTHSLMW